MTTVLVDCGSLVITSHRCSPVRRLLTSVRSYGLDRTLALGVNPDSSPELSLRARTLIAPGKRHGLARQVRAVIALANRPRNPFDPRVRPSRSGVLGERDWLEAIAERLDGPDPVDACGVARVEMLLRDGAGPLYYAPASPGLRASLERALDALQIEFGIPADA